MGAKLVVGFVAVGTAGSAEEALPPVGAECGAPDMPRSVRRSQIPSVCEE